jgi:hypothetical protein
MSRRTEEVLADLVADLRPVQRLAAPGWRAAGWLATAAAIVGAAVAWHGLRPDIGARLALPYEVGQWLASVATGVLAAVAAFLVALPDRSPRWALLPLPALAVWLASLGWGCFADLARMGPQALALGTSWSCLRFIIGVGLPLLGSMLWVLRHAASIRPVPVALLGGLAAAPLCSAGLSLFHHLDAALMILLWHGGAIALVTGLGGAVGRTVYTR